jgi:hypothetical protein
MKTKFPPLLMISAISLTVLFQVASAQSQLGKNKGPTSKIYIAETKGETQIVNNEKVYTARQATAFDAPGTVIETKPDSHDALVYSNGTGMYVDQNTRVEIARFVQEPFHPDRKNSADAQFEPSISQSNVFVPRGAIGICTSQLVSGSTMTYTTPLALVNIRNGKMSIEARADATIIDLLEGDITVHSGGKDLGGQILRPGERAVIRPGLAGEPPSLTISEIPKNELEVIDERVSIACNAKKTVTFETIDKTGSSGQDNGNPDQEIVPKPTVPNQLPANITVSADRLP